MKWPSFYSNKEETRGNSNSNLPLTTKDNVAAREETPLLGGGGSTNVGGGTNDNNNAGVSVIQVELNAQEDDEDFMQDFAQATYSSAVSQNPPQQQPGGGAPTEPQFTLLFRHDSEFSVGSDYKEPAHHADDAATVQSLLNPPPLLSALQGAILLTADCLGTGLLALPGDVKVLGYFWGLGFLILNGPINLYAGTVLAHAATTVERRQAAANRIFGMALQKQQQQEESIGQQQQQQQQSSGHNRGESTSSINNPAYTDTAKSMMSVITIESTLENINNNNNNNNQRGNNNNTTNTNTTNNAHTHAHLHHDTATFDFIGMTQALFQQPSMTRTVMALYYTNIFLVLGNYILVMSHAVVAAVGSNLCIPQAGLIASVGMFLVSQSRTMARLGRTASIASLLALLVVVVQCLYSVHYENGVVELDGDDNTGPDVRRHLQDNDIGQLHHQPPRTLADTAAEFGIGAATHDLLRQLAALGSIGFAMGSQKLFLNIRHELKDRRQAPLTLAMSLALYTTVYVLIVLLAGSNPPDFLFDAIQGSGRRLAGFLLWAHVIVSYAINSQAICSSMDRLFWHRLLPQWPTWHNVPALRWMLLTLCMAATAYTVANAIPFFQDLVALIGAVTSVPLTLLMPAIFWRKQLQVPIWWPSKKWFCGMVEDGPSFGLLVFSLLFMVVATAGVLDSIAQDWQNHGGRPFACDSGSAGE